MTDTNDRPVYCKGTNTHLLVPLRADLPLVLRWMNDEEVVRFLMPRPPLFEKNEEDWLDSLARDRMSNQVLMIGTADRTPIGIIGLHRINWISRVATLGISIGEKSHWGSGHGTEAIMLLLHNAFMHSNLRKIELQVHQFNKRAIKCYKRCGFNVEGRWRRHVFLDGQYHNTLIMGAFEEGWHPAWDAYKVKLAAA